MAATWSTRPDHARHLQRRSNVWSVVSGRTTRGKFTRLLRSGGAIGLAGAADLRLPRWNGVCRSSNPRTHLVLALLAGLTWHAPAFDLHSHRAHPGRVEKATNECRRTSQVPMARARKRLTRLLLDNEGLFRVEPVPAPRSTPSTNPGCTHS